jgi:nucleoside-diphosphate-sugar epimerase
MNILLTGASGFLGKHVLRQLVADERVSRVVVSTRKKRRHDSPKVEVRVLDLTHSADFPIDLSNIDAILHLAGLYDFNASFKDCYEQNVMATLNLVRAVRESGRSIPIHFASTYAVGCHSGQLLREEALVDSPPPSEPYAHTKAIAESCLAESGLPVRIFRLGILMGDSKRGEIEKLDGPYAFFRLIRSLSRLPLSQKISKIPIPAAPEAVLPLVPVDIAAGVLVESCLSGGPEVRGTEIKGAEFYGVYLPSSARVRDVVQAAIDEFMPNAKPWYVDARLPERLLSAQQRFTGVAASAWNYANQHTQLESSAFESHFGKNRIPAFAEQRAVWIRGFRNYMDGTLS